MMLRKKVNKPLLIAHRGGNLAGSERENTLSAFMSALKLGYKYLETDVILSKDGQIVAYHGSANWYIEAKTGLMRRSKMQKLSYEQICIQIKPGGEKIPLLKDLLKSFPDTFFSIDAKTNGVVEPLIKLIKAEKAQKRISITSFSLKRSKVFAKAFGVNAQIGFCVHPKLANVFKLTLKRKLDRLSASGIRLIHFPHRHLSRQVVDQAHKQNIQVWVWTVNDRESMQKIAAIGVDGIISDDIKLLKNTISIL